MTSVEHSLKQGKSWPIVIRSVVIVLGLTISWIMAFDRGVLVAAPTNARALAAQLRH